MSTADKRAAFVAGSNWRETRGDMSGGRECLCEEAKAEALRWCPDEPEEPGLRERVAKEMCLHFKGYGGYGDEWKWCLPEAGRILALLAHPSPVQDAAPLREDPIRHDDKCRMRRGGRCDCGAAEHNRAAERRRTTVQVHGEVRDVAEFDPPRRWRCKGCGRVIDCHPPALCGDGILRHPLGGFDDGWCGPVEEVKP